MFGSIAHRYDLLNHLLSASVDRHWRRVTRRKLAKLLPSGAKILDLCTGTGDLAIELSGCGPVVGCDFAHPMLVLSQGKIRRKDLTGKVRLVEADALRLPFPPGGFDAVSIAFGFRNLENYPAGLDEMARILRPGGWLAILEFSEPAWPIFRQIYLLYFKHVLPRLGEWLSGRPGAYSYLMQSVMEFPDADKLKLMLEKAGCASVRQFRLTGGIATLHLGQKRQARLSAGKADADYRTRP